MPSDKKESKVDDISPGSPLVESVLFRENEGGPLKERSYELTASDSNPRGTTDSDGRVADLKLERKDLKVKLELAAATAKGSADYPDNPGPLDPLELREKSEGGKGAMKPKDSRKELVKHLQLMLKALGFDLGSGGSDHDGVTGAYDEKTIEAVKGFQSSGVKGLDDKPLGSDGKVGPGTSDALNRALVGKWYAKYKTPEKLTPKRVVLTVVSSDLSDGVVID